MKTCTLCKTEKPLSDFPPRKKGLPALHAWCRPCLHSRKMEWRARNPRPSRAKMGPPKPRPPRKPDMKWADYPEEKKKRYKEVQRLCMERRKEEYDMKKAEYRQANREKLSQKQREYYNANRDRYRVTNLAYIKKRYREDALFALASLYRSRVRISVREQGFSKTSRTAEMLGCSYEELVLHLEPKFLPGMPWQNRGRHGWHIDHKIPLVSATSAEELQALCHFSNLQPLWAEDNLKKGAKMPHELTG